MHVEHGKPSPEYMREGKLAWRERVERLQCYETIQAVVLVKAETKRKL